MTYLTGAIPVLAMLAYAQEGAAPRAGQAPAWVAQVDGQVAAAPAYADGSLYFGDWQGNFHAVDAATGAARWSRFVGISPPPDPQCSPPLGVSSQAAVANGMVYVGGGDAAVYALDRATGKLLWRVAVGDPDAGAYIWSPITVYRGILYLGMASLGDCPLVRGALVRIDPADPQHPRFAYLAPEGQEGGAVWSAPAIDPNTNTVYVTTGAGDQDAESGLFGGALAAFDAATLKMKAYYFLPAATVDGDVEWGSSPTLFTTAAGRPLVAATGTDGVLYALSRDGLSLIWSSQVAEPCDGPQSNAALSTPAFDGNTLYVGTGTGDGLSAAGTVRALDPSTGKPRWTTGTAGAVIAPLTVSDGLVYAPTDRGLLVFDAATGARLADDGNFGLPYSQAVVAGGTVFTSYLFGKVVAWQPVPGAEAVERRPAL